MHMTHKTGKITSPLPIWLADILGGGPCRWLTLWHGLVGLVVSPDVSGNINPSICQSDLKWDLWGKPKVCRAFVAHRCNRSTRHQKTVYKTWRNARSVWSLACRFSVNFEIAAKCQVLRETPELSFFLLNVQFSCSLLPHLLTVFIPP